MLNLHRFIKGSVIEEKNEVCFVRLQKFPLLHSSHREEGTFWAEKMTLLNFLGVSGKAFLVVCCRFNLRVKSPRFRSQFCYPPIEADQNMGFLGCSSVRHLLTSLEIIAVIFNVGGGRAIPVLLSWKHEQRNFKNALFVFCYCWAEPTSERLLNKGIGKLDWCYLAKHSHLKVNQSVDCWKSSYQEKISGACIGRSARSGGAPNLHFPHLHGTQINTNPDVHPRYPCSLVQPLVRVKFHSFFSIFFPFTVIKKWNRNDWKSRSRNESEIEMNWDW